MRQVFEHPQVIARGMRVDLPHATAADGSVPGLACPIKLVGEDLPSTAAPPLLGEHTDSVLREVAGLDDVQIRALREEQVIG